MKPQAHSLMLELPEVKGRFKLVYHQWKSEVAEAPIALCLHGLTRNGRDFEYLAKELAQSHTVICPDLPGRGQSDWLNDTADYNYDSYLQIIVKLLEYIGAEQVDWVGTSLGGILGMRIAAEQPQRIRKMVLNDIGAVIPAEGISRINNYVGLAMQFSGRDAAEAHLREIYAGFGIADDAHWKHLLDHSFNRLSNGDYQLAYDPGILDPVRDETKKLKNTQDVELWPWWDAITAPVLLLRGERSDILTQAVAQEMAVRHTTTKLIEYSGIGHAPTLMEEEQIQAVCGFLRT